MTTIAWDGTTMAADKRANVGGVRMTVTKIRRGKDGNLVGVAGTAALTESIFEWLCDGGDRPDAQGEKSDWCCILEVSPEGQCFRHERLGKILVEDAVYALGSGGDFARAAMALGCSAQEAVELAGRFDTYTGDGIDLLPLNPAAPRRSKAKPRQATR